MKYIKWIIGILAIIGVAIISIVTVNKFNTSKLFTSVKEYFFLKDRGYKRKDDKVTNDEGDEIDIPEQYEDNTITGAGHSTEYDVGEGTINHETVDRKNTTPIENSYKKKVDKKQ